METRLENFVEFIWSTKAVVGSILFIAGIACTAWFSLEGPIRLTAATGETDPFEPIADGVVGCCRASDGVLTCLPAPPLLGVVFFFLPSNGMLFLVVCGSGLHCRQPLPVEVSRFGVVRSEHLLLLLALISADFLFNAFVPSEHVLVFVVFCTSACLCCGSFWFCPVGVPIWPFLRTQFAFPQLFTAPPRHSSSCCCFTMEFWGGHFVEAPVVANGIARFWPFVESVLSGPSNWQLSCCCKSGFRLPSDVIIKGIYNGIYLSKLF